MQVFVFIGEEWRDVIINGFKTGYTVSSKGNVRKPNGLRARTHLGSKGYLYTWICDKKHGIIRHVSVHRLVAIAFIPNPENKPTVNHINGRQKTNNTVANLEWATYGENNGHMYATGLSHVGQEHHFTKYEDSVILEVIKYLSETDLTIGQVAKKLSVPRHLVSDIYYRDHWKHLSKDVEFVSRAPKNSVYYGYRDSIVEILMDDINIRPTEIAKILNIEYDQRLLYYIGNLKKQLKKQNKSSTTIPEGSTLK